MATFSDYLYSRYILYKRARQEDKDEAYQRGLSNRELEVAYARIMLLGSAGVGKTSLKRGLMNLPIDSKANSTIVADVQSVRPVGYEWAKVGDEENKEWREVTDDDELNELAQLLAIVCKNPRSAHNLLSTVAATVAAASLFPIANMIPPSSISHKDVEQVEKTSVNSILSQAIERAKRLRPDEIQNLKPQPFLHIWDCGGQPVFLEVLPAFLTSRTMFLLLFDASKDFLSRWKSVQYQRGREIVGEETNMTTLELMEGWMTNIHAHLAKHDADQALLEYPRIITIGTRGDKLTPNEKRNVTTKMEKHLSGKVYSEVMKKVFIVDNTTAGTEVEDETYRNLRNEIYDFTLKKLIVKTPISWVLFRKVLQMLAKNKRNTISLSEAHAIGVACKIKHEDVPKALMFYHDLGVVLFYPNIKGLKDKVILSPKWFVDCLGKVLTLEGRETYETMLMWNLLREKGILVQPLYVAVWRECEGIKPEDMIELLVHFRLAAQVETNQYYIPSVKQFFLPAVLSSYRGDPTVASAGYRMRATLLHIAFLTGYVTPGFFTRLVTTMAGSPHCHLNFDEGIFRNRVTFRFGDPPIDHVTLTEIHNAIQVDALRHAPEAPKPFHSVCKNLQLTIELSCCRVNECLSSVPDDNDDPSKIPSNSKVAREIRFICQGQDCDSASDLHYLIHSPGQTIDLPLNCEKSKKYRRPSPEEAYWFPDEYSNKKSRRLSEKELYCISQEIGDKLTNLAAVVGMTLQLQTLQQDVTKRDNVCFHLLYDWERRGGEREQLVETLETIGLQQLAKKVTKEEYAPKEEMKCKTPTRFTNQSGLQSVNKDESDLPLPILIPSQHHVPMVQQSIDKVTNSDTQSGLQSVDKDEGNLPLPIVIPSQHHAPVQQSIDKVTNSDTQSGLQSVDKHESNLSLPILIPSQHHAPMVQQFVDKVTNSGTYQVPPYPVHSNTFLNESSFVPSSSPTADPKAPPTDADLLLCSRHFTDDLTELAGLADISDDELEEIKKKYKKMSIQALQIMKTWRNTSKGSRQDLYEILLCLGLSDAAEKLINPKR